MSSIHTLPDDGSDTSQPPAKKQRLDPRTFKNRAGESQATHDWSLDDRVVALRTPAQPDTDVHSSIFLASRYILCRDSEVFKDILTVPQTQAELYEGHPIVDVQDDPRDMQDLLEALHNYVQFTLSSHSTEAFAIAAIIRLCHKYAVPNLRRTILLRLKTMIPTTYEEFHRSEELNDLCKTPTDTAHLLQALEITGEFPILLPFLYYRYIFLGDWFEAVLWDAKITDKPQAAIDSDDKVPIWIWSETSRMRVIRMHANTTKLCVATLHSMFGVRTRTQCRSPSACNRVPPLFTQNIATQPQWMSQIKDGAMAFLNRATYTCVIDRLCERCRPEANARMEKLIGHLWQMLPSLVGLESWEVISAQSNVDAALPSS